MKKAPLYPQDNSFREVSRAASLYLRHPGFIRYILANRISKAEPDTSPEAWSHDARTIVTLPGWAGNARSMGFLNAALKAETCNIINGVDIGLNVKTPVKKTAQATYQKITEVLGLEPSDIDIVGYSQGGLTALALQKQALDQGRTFQSITTLGTPFLGTPLVEWPVKGVVSQDMSPQSKTIQELILSGWNPKIPVNIIKTLEDHIAPESRDALDSLPGESFDTQDHWIHLFKEHAQETAFRILELIERSEKPVTR